jgi:hypothetical protein
MLPILSSPIDINIKSHKLYINSVFHVNQQKDYYHLDPKVIYRINDIEYPSTFEKYRVVSVAREMEKKDFFKEITSHTEFMNIANKLFKDSRNISDTEYYSFKDAIEECESDTPTIEGM